MIRFLNIFLLTSIKLLAFRINFDDIILRLCSASTTNAGVLISTHFMINQATANLKLCKNICFPYDCMSRYVTRRISNSKSCLVSRSHNFAISLILDLTPYLLRWYVQIYPRIIMPKSHENTLLRIIVFKSHGSMSRYVDTVTLFSKKLELQVDDPKMTFDPTYVEITSVTLSKDRCIPSPMKICPSMWIQWPFLKKKLEAKFIDP